MFKVPEDKAFTKITEAEKNYSFQPNDIFSVKVYANNGERLVDPEFELRKAEKMQEDEEPESYIVNEQGIAKLPLVNDINVAGLTVRQAEELLQKEYTRFYKDPFVKIEFLSKRVIVLGASGGQVIPLTHNNMLLVEVLALAKGITNEGKAHNLRIMRGQEILVADLSTIEGYRNYNIPMQSGDVVYIEPVRKPFAESLRDYAPAVTLFSSLTTLIVVIVGL